jgi:hypothetical protein
MIGCSGGQSTAVPVGAAALIAVKHLSWQIEKQLSFTSTLIKTQNGKIQTARATKENSKTSMADAAAQAPAPTRAIPELSSSSEKPSHASSLAEAEAPHAHGRREASLFSRRRMLGPVVKEYGDYGLLATSLVTGMVDGASFLNWGVFVGMQTGKSLSIVDRRFDLLVGCCELVFTCIHLLRMACRRLESQDVLY